MKIFQLLVAAGAACAFAGVDAAKCTAKTSAPVATTAAPMVTTATPVATTATPETFPTVTTATPTAAISADASASEETENEADPEEVDNKADSADVDTSSSYDDAASASASASSSATSNTTASTGTSTSTSSSSSDHATFGTVTSADGECVIGDSAEYISTEYVDWVWEKRMSTYVPQFTNYIFDQLHTNNGSLTYCVRWDSTESLSKSVASKFEAMLNRQFKAWNQWLIGYDCWPFNEIDVKVVGFAVRDASLLDWSDDSLGKIYEGVLDSDGIPQCPTACYKHQNFEASADTSACEGTPFDMSLWPTLGMGGGAGGDWGQRVDAESMLSTIDDDQLVIVAHEIGHGFGLPDFYETTDKPANDFPKCIMEAGASMTITPGDGWMLRRVYEHINDRYD